MIGIYVHHTSRFARNTGIQRCVRAMARALAEIGQPIVPLVWESGRQGLALANRQALEHLARWNGPPVDAWTLQPPPKGSWLLVVELVSGPHQPEQPWLRLLADQMGWHLAGVFHDAIPLGWGGPAARYHRQYMLGLARYDLVLANSRTSANDLAAFWRREGLPSGMATTCARLAALPLADELPGSPRCWPPPKPLSKRAHQLRLLCVGSLEPRKNHRSLLKALAWLMAQGVTGITLQVVGWANDGVVVEQVQRAIALGLPVYWDASADDQALRTYYEGCDLTVYPSLEEGFGLPVVESLWLGRPCLMGAAGALAELSAGGGCEVVDTGSWKALAEAIGQLCGQPHQLERLQHQLRARPMRRWIDHAAAMVERMRA